jgi:hypothetical protein
MGRGIWGLINFVELLGFICKQYASGDRRIKKSIGCSNSNRCLILNRIDNHFPSPNLSPGERNWVAFESCGIAWSCLKMVIGKLVEYVRNANVKNETREQCKSMNL